MKRMFVTATVVFALMSCGNAALDGDPKTDTTNLPIDTGSMQTPSDTADHINTNTGTYPVDSNANSKTDVRSSSSSTPGSRSTTPGNTSSQQR